MTAYLTAKYTLKGVWLAAVGLVILLCIGAAVVQTARLEGVKIWPIKIEGWKPKAERLQDTLDKVKAAQIEAERLAKEAKAKAEREYAGLAKEVDDNATQEMADSRSDAERFIAAGGVRRQGDCASSAAPAPARDNSARDTAGAGSPPLVDGLITVYPEDVRICTENTVKAEAAHDWAMGLTDHGRYRGL